MYEAPKCLSRRHEIMDKLLQDLTNYMSDTASDNATSPCRGDSPIKLLCTLWNMIREDPPCEGCPSAPSCLTPPCCPIDQPSNSASCTVRNFSSYTAQEPQKRIMKHSTLVNHLGSVKQTGSCILPESTQRVTVCPFPGSKRTFHVYNQHQARTAKSFDQNCELKIEHLVGHQNLLLEQINDIEQREKAGMEMLQEADEMWVRMENAYKEKIERTKELQKEVSQECKVLEDNVRKWKLVTKEMEFELSKTKKALEVLNESLNRNNEQLKIIDNDIATSEKKIAVSQKEIEAAERSLETKQKHSDAITEKIASKITKLSASIYEERKIKAEKEKEGLKYMDDAREDLQNIWKLLLKTKFMNEDLRVEKENIQNDITILSSTHKDCKERCQMKRDSILDDIKKIDDEIQKYKVTCSRCNQLLDTSDFDKFCTDCPVCLQQRECLLNGTTCSRNPATECVCHIIKKNFMQNVLENMSMNLQKQVDDGAGTAVGEVVLKCLRRNQNGKVDVVTKKILQDFILTTVRKHLNLTIVGGAMKTRCEMDEDTYDRLMNCIHGTEVEQVPTEDKSTSKKRPCKRWEGAAECHCPRGPKGCVCVQKAPIPTKSSYSKGRAVPCHPVTHIDRDEGGSRIKDSRSACNPSCTKCEDCYTSDIAKWRAENFREACSGVWSVQDPSTFKPVTKKKSYSSQDSCSQSQCESWAGSDGEQQQKVHSPKKKGQKDLKYNISDNDSDSPTKDNERIKGAYVSNYAIKHAENSSFRHIKPKRPIRKHKIKRQQKFSATPVSKGDENSDVIELTRTPSGNPAMAFDEMMIKKINLKLNESSDMQVYIRKVEKDRYILDINSENNESNEIAKIRKTPSGHLVMDAPKNIIETTGKTEKQDSSDPVSYNDESEAVKLCVKTEDGESTYIDGTITRSASGKINVNLQNALKLKEFFDKKIPIVEVVTDSDKCKLDITSISVKPNAHFEDTNINCSNNFQKCTADSAESKLMGLSSKLSRELGYLDNIDEGIIPDVTHTLITKISQNVKVIENNTQGSQALPADYKSFGKDLFLKKISGEIEYELSPFANNPYIFNNKESTSSSHFTNGTVDKKDSETFLGKIFKKLQRESGLLINQPIMNQNKNIKQVINSDRKSSFLDRISNKMINELDFHVEQPNCDPNMGLHKIRVEGIFPNELFEPPAALQRTYSGNYLLIMDKEFDENCKRSISHYKPNNEVKISVSKSDHFIHIDLDSQNHDPFISSGNLTRTLSGNLKLLLSNQEILKQTKEPNKNYKVVGKHKINKAFETIRCKLFLENNEPKHLISKVSNKGTISCDQDLEDDKCVTAKDKSQLASSKSINKTKSGMYNLVLDQTSKKKFIEDIQVVLKNSNGIIPISREETGEIKIILNQKDNIKDIEYLRVTPSGNIYLLVNDEIKERLTVEKEEPKTKIRSSAKIGTSDNVEVAVETFCNAECDKRGCKPGICHCKELLRQLNENSCMIDYKTSSLKKKCPVDTNIINKSSNKEKNTSSSCNQNMDCDCSSRAYDQWLCMTNSPDILWEHNHKIVANEYIDISNLCDKEVVDSNDDCQQERRTNFMHEIFWKHIEDLPPLLPAFLRN